MSDARPALTDRSVATYRLGSPVGRIVQACLILPFAVFFGYLSLLLLRSGPWGWFFTVSFPGPIAAVLVGGIWQSLSRPYEVHIGSAGEVRFVSVIGTTELVRLTSWLSYGASGGPTGRSMRSESSIRTTI